MSPRREQANRNGKAIDKRLVALSLDGHRQGELRQRRGAGIRRAARGPRP